MPRGRPRKYSDRQRFIISVLWLYGMSDRQIADSMRAYLGVPMTSKAVGGVLGQTPFRGRSDMPAAVRQRFLDTLKRHRLDRGALPDQFFKVK